MNIINKVFLKLAMLPAPIYKKMGVDQRVLIAILDIKLTMDDRRVSGIQQTSHRESNKQVSSATIITMIVSAVLGLLYLVAFSVGRDIVTSMSFYFFIFFFMLSATLISDFTSVLIDVRDTFIILPKPVNDQTVLLARLLHIFIHICKLVLPMSLPGIIYVGIKYGIGAALCMIPMVLLLTLLAIFFINAAYIIILKITTPQKFQNIISYFQIIFAISIYAGYQVLPRLIQRAGIAEFDISQTSWAVFLPMYWMASAWNSLWSFNFTTESSLCFIAAVSVPLLCIWLVIKFLAPSFNNKLALINSTADNPVLRGKRTLRKKADFVGRLAGLVTKEKAEWAGFVFAWKMTSRSRDFKLKVYPSVGYLLVLAIIAIFRSDTSWREISPDSSYFKTMMIVGIYFMSLLLITALSQMAYSEKYKAAWIFAATPLKRPGEVIMGALKAIVFRFYIPIIIIITIPAIIIGGARALPNLLLGASNQLLIVAILVFIDHRSLPFSRKQSAAVKTGSFARNLGVMMVSGFIAIIHYLIFDNNPVVWIGVLLSALATWLITGSIRNTGWEMIKKETE